MAESKWPRQRNWLAALWHLALGVFGIIVGLIEGGGTAVGLFIAAPCFLYFSFLYGKKALRHGQTSDS